MTPTPDPDVTAQKIFAMTIAGAVAFVVAMLYIIS